MSLSSSQHDKIRFRVTSDEEPGRSIVSQGNLGAIYTEDPWPTAGRSFSRDDLIAW